MTAPSLMFEHRLTPTKGWFQPAALDHQAKMSANVEFSPNAGRVVHLNAAGEFEMGIAGASMPLFLFSGASDFDVAIPGVTPGGLFMHKAISPAGNLQALVATGGYELQSTEFDTTKTYAPNELLTAAASNCNSATGGVITNAGTGDGGRVEQFVDPVCGVVSRGSFNNEHGVPVVAFWPLYLPGAFV